MSNVHDLTVDVLRKIHDSMLRQEEAHAGTNRRLDEMNARLDQTNARLEHLIELSGGHWRGHEERLAQLEERVERIEGQVGA